MVNNVIHSDPVYGSRALLASLLLILSASANMSAAEAPGTPVSETPLVITSGYGIDGLVLWLDAGSGVTMDKENNVQALADRTGNFNLQATNSDREPTYVPGVLHGLPVLRFNPDQSLYSDDEFGSELDRAMTMIVVVETNAARTFFQYPIYLGQNRTPQANRALAFSEGHIDFDGQWAFFEGPPVTRNSFAIIGVTVDATVSQARFYRGGLLVAMSNLSEKYGKRTFGPLSHGVTLGAATDPCRGWLGDIAEVLVFNRQLSAAEMLTIGASLSEKYGLTQGAAARNTPSP